MYRKLLSVGLLVFCLLSNVANAFTESKDGITLSARNYTADELVIDADGWQLKGMNFAQNGFKPVLLIIQNNSDEEIAISARSLRIKQVDRNDLAPKFRYRTILRPFLYLCAFDLAVNLSFLTLAMTFTSALNFMKSYKTFLDRCIWAVEIGCFGSYHWYLRTLNEKLDVLLQDIILDQTVVIAPGESVQKVLLFENNINSMFAFRILHADTQETKTGFDINLNL